MGMKQKTGWRVADLILLKEVPTERNQIIVRVKSGEPSNWIFSTEEEAWSEVRRRASFVKEKAELELRLMEELEPLIKAREDWRQNWTSALNLRIAIADAALHLSSNIGSG